MKLLRNVICLGIIWGCLFSPISVKAQAMPDELAEAEAFALGYQAYVTGFVYAKSQLLMERATHPAYQDYAPINSFYVSKELAKPGFTDFTPNADTIYALAWLDLRQGPVLITIPEVKERYYSIQATDYALDTFSYIGNRVNSKPGTYAYVPPGWKGALPKNVTRIEATTTGVFLQARTVVSQSDPADLAKVVNLLAQYKLEPLNKDAKYAATDKSSPLPSALNTEPVFTSLDFFALLNRALSFGGLRVQDQPLIAQLAPLGIGPGLKFDPARLTAAQRRGLQRATEVVHKRLGFYMLTYGEKRNNWRYDTTLGNYGYRNLMASAVAYGGYGANMAVEALYPGAFVDSKGDPLSSDRNYVIRFPKDQMPPAEAFWSVTLYSLPGNQLRENSINRYAIGDRTPNLRRGSDGSIEIYVQKDKPAGDKATNWLPTGEGRFWLVLRMYIPKPEALTGGYNPPFVERVEQ